MALFEIKTQKERDKEALAYRKMIYPFGDKQMEWEDEVIKTLFTDRKRHQTIKYMLIVKRENLIKEALEKEEGQDSSAEESQKEWNKLVKKMKLTQQEQNWVNAVAEFEVNAESFEQFPEAEKIKEFLSIEG